MGTGDTLCLEFEQVGILPRVFKFIFEERKKRILECKKNNSNNTIQVKVCISFLEIYNEELIDLISDDKQNLN